MRNASLSGLDHLNKTCGVTAALGGYFVICGPLSQALLTLKVHVNVCCITASRMILISAVVLILVPQATVTKRKNNIH